MRRALQVGGGLLALIGLGVLAIHFLVDKAALRPMVESQLTSALGRSVSLGGLDFSVIPPTLELSQIGISEDPAFGKESFLTATRLNVRVALIPLIQKKVEIQSLRLVEPRIRFVKDRAGRWNAASIGSKDSGGSSSDLTLSRLTLEKAKLHVNGFDAPEMTVELRDAEITKARAKGALSLLEGGPKSELNFDIATPGPVDVTLVAGSSRLQVKGTSGDTLDLTAELASTPIQDLAQLASLFGVAFAPGYQVGGSMALSAKIKGSSSKPSIEGRTQIRDLQVQGGDLKQPVRVPKIAVDFTPQALRSQPFEAIAGPTRLNGFFSLTGYSEPSPRLEATLVANESRLEDLLAIARTYRVAALQGVDGDGRASLQLRLHGVMRTGSTLQYTGSAKLDSAQLTLPSLTKPIKVASLDARFEADSARIDKLKASIGSTTLEGQATLANFANPRAEFSLAVDKLDSTEAAAWVKDSPSGKATASKSGSPMTATGSLRVGQLKLSQIQMTNVASQARYENQVLTLDPLTADIYGGKHRGAVTLNLKGGSPVVNVRSTLESIESSQLVAAVTPLRQIISGPMTAQLALDFTQGSSDDIAKALNGQVKLNFTKGKLMSFSLLDELASIAKFLKLNPDTAKMTSFLSLTGDLTIKNGVATTDNMKLDLDRATTTLSGTLGLSDQALNLKLNTILNKAYSEQVGGTKIGGYLNTAVSNANGEMILPTLVTGTFANPRFVPDAGAIAKLKMQSLVPGLAKPGAAGQPANVNETVKGVIDIFKKKKPAEPAKPQP